ncbi:unnamed protein product [Sphagnum jensenii]|uniref:Uncharacterized protein n=1 Tax=Sphagnum jensenii TaxID=128206 RepID=A0ABP0ZXV7_9BRYO
MAHMWEFDGRVTKTCSPETMMAMFGHKFYYNDCVPASLFFRPQLGTVFLMTSSRLNHYTAAILNPGQCEYGCALYVRRSTQTTYVKRQDFMEQMGDMLDFAMRQANVARR